MKNLAVLGVVLIVLGAAALFFGNFTWSETKPVADIGPVHINKEEEHHVSVPTIAGIVVIVAGLGLIVIGRRSA